MAEEIKSTKILPPIEHSLHKDTVSISGEIVDNDSIPTEDALMLANIKTTSANKRRAGMYRAMAILVIVAAVVLFVLPNIFPNSQEPAVVVQNDSTKNLIKSDISYALPMPTQNQVTDFRKKVFKSNAAIAELSLQTSGMVVPYQNLAPLVNDRFIKNLTGVATGQYVYGLYTGDDKVSHPFLIIKVTNNRDSVEKALLASERTMYNDLGVILQLPEDTTIETKAFQTVTSVRNPTRELLDNNNTSVIVYGFAMDDIVVFAPSQTAYNAVRARILTGY